MSQTSIPQPVKYFLWGKSAGRCQYRGCNKKLFEDPLKKSDHNTAYHAHIIGDSPKGPRGSEEKSEELAKDLTNLMLLCDSCHRRIDKTEKEIHTVEILLQMKKEHEDRINLITDIKVNESKHIFMYGANIGDHSSSFLSYDNSAQALLDDQSYPATNTPIELSLKNSSFKDKDELFWTIESQHLKNEFNSKIRPLISSGSVQNLGVFAIAPQPLLTLLGTMIGDIVKCNVYQPIREPKTWSWQKGSSTKFVVKEGEADKKNVALKLSLSANITDDRIVDVIGEDCSIWEITHSSPNNDFIKSKIQLEDFRKEMRLLFNKIKQLHGQNTILHIFPAMPVSTAIELGRVWMPKADMKLHLYDQNWETKGFSLAVKLLGDDHE
ncbi:MAG: SAVED domain-containing protein [Bdellovibrionota bacterium]|nr:SAVED domain-containing protein [Bdellovibrionota bacterium]